MFTFRARLGLGMLILGGVLIYFGVREAQLGMSASAEPEAITLKALLDRGATGNPHVLVRDYVLDVDRGVEKGQENNAGEWQVVWVPIAPAGEVKPGEPFPIRAVIRSKRVHHETDLRLLQPTVHGMVVNGIESLGSDERKVMEEMAAGADLGRCLIIDDERAPSDASWLFGFFGGGVALVAVGVFLMVWGIRGRLG
jgi:hypothetical protein